MTALASIIFALFDPAKSVLHGKHPGHIDPTGSNTTLTADSTLDLASNITRSLLNVRDAVESSGPNSVAIVFRYVFVPFRSFETTRILTLNAM